jgi:hypothetical protein
LVKILSKIPRNLISEVANMLNHANEQVWQFNVPNSGQIRDNGIGYFQTRAKEMAATIGCTLAGVKNIRLELVRGSWKVTGTAILAKTQATG